MKHLFHLVAILFLCLTSCAQPNNAAVSALKKDVKEANKGLPMEVAFFRMDKIEIKGNDYIVYATLDENQMNFDNYLDNMNENKSGIFSMIAQGRQEFANLFAESGLNLKYVVTGKQSKRVGEFLLSSDEIKQSMATDFSIRDYMADLVKSMQDDLPQDWGDGCSLTAIYIEGEYACYRIKTDETVLTIPLLKASKEQGNLMEDSLIESFSNPQDEFEKLIAKCLKESGYGVRYIFWSDKTPESVTFTITPDVIQSRLGGTSSEAASYSNFKSMMEEDGLQVKGYAVDGNVKDLANKFKTDGVGVFSEGDDYVNLTGISYYGYDDCTLAVRGTPRSKTVYTVEISLPYTKDLAVLKERFFSIRKQFLERYKAESSSAHVDKYMDALAEANSISDIYWNSAGIGHESKITETTITNVDNGEIRIFIWSNTTEQGAVRIHFNNLKNQELRQQEINKNREEGKSSWLDEL